MFLRKPARYKVDLSDSAKNKWEKIIDENYDKLKNVMNHINPTINSIKGNKFFSKMLDFIILTAKNMKLILYSDEIDYLSKRLDMNFSDIFLLQLMYEFSACCTSIISKTKNGKICHARSMDWDMTYLKDLTIEIDFYDKKKHLFTGITWAGYLGIFTGISKNKWSISLNYRKRDSPNIVKNIKNIIWQKWPAGFLIRECLSKDIDFQEAKRYFMYSELISPCYFIICGSELDQGAIITRDSNELINIRDIEKDEKFLIQTNMDYWEENKNKNILLSKIRRERAQEYLENNDINNPFNLWELMFLSPILNGFTIYITLMIPSDDYTETLIPK